MNTMHERTVVVAGAGGRLGGYVVRELLRRGARVAGISRDADALTAAVTEAPRDASGGASGCASGVSSGGAGIRVSAGAAGEEAKGQARRFVPLVASASDEEQLARAASELAELGWRPDALVVCLGGWWQDGPITGVDQQEWGSLFASHLLGHALAVRTFAPLLAEAEDAVVVMSGGVGTEQVLAGSGPVSVFGAAQRALLLTLRAEDPGQVRFHEVAIMGPLAEDERNDMDDGDRPVPASLAAAAIAEVIAAEPAAGAIVHVLPPD